MRKGRAVLWLAAGSLFVFGFTHVWRRDRDRWQIARVLSYGH